MVLISDNKTDLTVMLVDLKEKAKSTGIKINMVKTKIMMPMRDQEFQIDDKNIM